MDFENIVDLVDKNKSKFSSNDYLKIMNSLKNIYDIKNSNHGIIKSKNNEEEEEEDTTYYNFNEDEDTYASLWK
tara:strand:+ start:313 stop:534 length:222 start_codon:yes stop_codon:yes gene_type:complete